MRTVDRNLLDLQDSIIQHPLCGRAYKLRIGALTSAALFHNNQTSLQELTQLLNDLKYEFNKCNFTFSKLTEEVKEQLKQLLKIEKFSLSPACKAIRTTLLEGDGKSDYRLTRRIQWLTEYIQIYYDIFFAKEPPEGTTSSNSYSLSS